MANIGKSQVTKKNKEKILEVDFLLYRWEKSMQKNLYKVPMVKGQKENSYLTSLPLYKTLHIKRLRKLMYTIVIAITTKLKPDYESKILGKKLRKDEKLGR